MRWLAVAAGVLATVSIACTVGPPRQAALEAHALLEEGRAEEALTAYREGRRQWPAMEIFPHGEGVALYVLKRHAEAEAPLRAAIGLAPDEADHHVYLGHVLSELKRYDEAIRAYEEAIRLAPTDARAWKGMGFAHYNVRRFAEARMALEKYLAFARGAPDYLSVWHLVQTLPSTPEAGS